MLELRILSWLEDESLVLVTANGNYDFLVLVNQYPGLIHAVFDAYEKGRIVCLQTRQKLMDLAYDGDITSKRYNLAALETRYGLGDRSDQKKGDDVWRMRYAELLGIPKIDWPEAASEYALADASQTLAVAWEQDRSIKNEPPRQDITLGLHSAAAFALDLVKAHGMWIDEDRVTALSDALDELLSDDALRPLIEAGILRPAEPPRPYANGCGKMKAAKKASVDTKKLQEYFSSVYHRIGIPPVLTDGGKDGKNKKIATGAEPLSLLLSKIKYGDEILECWEARQEVNKLKTTYLPHLKEGIVYSNFDYLKATGRVSSRGSDLFPSMNSQNIPRIAGKLSIRECHIPRPGYIFCAIDYSGLELCSAAQQLQRIVGHSTLLESINRGIDSHAFLGAQICHKWDADFARTCMHMGVRGKEEIYEAFMAMKVDDPKTFKHYRTFAKPTGLGYPGGLGPETFMQFARTTYGVIVTMDEAVELRELWHSTYPEWKPYFEWVNSQSDPHNMGDLFYVSPMGMRRAATTYCATANGVALQTPSAEGMKAAHWKITRKCWDPTEESLLFSSRVVNVIHDELIIEMPDDELKSDRAKEAQGIMENTMTKFLPSVSISTEASLMRRWYKQAEPVFGANNELLLWEPTHQSKL